MSYNGWANYETWCVSMWLDNDESTYNDVRYIAEDYSADEAPALGQAIKDYVECMPEVTAVTDHASFVTDLLGAALSEVDWQEIATNLIEEQGQ